MLTLLTRDEFISTFVEPVRRFAGDEHYGGPSIGSYVRECVQQLALPVPAEQLDVHDVYRNGPGEGSFYHVLLSFGERNVYLVIVVDCKRASVYGHYILDLNEEYGLGGNATVRE
jgi:hypothetical protein